MLNNDEHDGEFRNTLDELNHIHDEIRARNNELDTLLETFEQLLRTCAFDEGTLVLHEHWALLHEVRHEYHKAATHRSEQVRLIEHVLASVGPIGPIDNQYLAAALRELARDLTMSDQRSEAEYAAQRADELEAKRQGRSSN